MLHTKAQDRRPLHRAAGGNHTEACIFLIAEKGATVDQVCLPAFPRVSLVDSSTVHAHIYTQTKLQKDKPGRTPFHWAAMGGHVDAAQILLDNGADIAAATR